MTDDVAICVGSIGEMTEADLRDLFGGLGLRTTMADNCAEARAYLRFARVKLLVVGLDDHRNTWGLLQAPREASRQDTVVVCASRRSTRTQVLSALRRGAQAFLVAPFDRAEVERCISPLLDRSGDGGWAASARVSEEPESDSLSQDEPDEENPFEQAGEFESERVEDPDEVFGPGPGEPSAGFGPAEEPMIG